MVLSIKHFLITVLALTALMTGCAKKEVVIPSSETIPASATTPQEQSTRDDGREQVVRDITENPAISANKEAAELRETQDPVVGLSVVYFALDSFVLDAPAREALHKNYLWLKNASGPARIEGHCDERGSGEYNLALGEKRAKAAMQYLVTLGVAPDRLSTVSYGEEKPAVIGHDEAAWSKNRRVVVVPVEK